MTQFLSFVTKGDGNPFCFDFNTRKKIVAEGNPRGYEFDNHSSICQFHGLIEDKCNKWEYSLTYDNIADDGLYAGNNDSEEALQAARAMDLSVFYPKSDLKHIKEAPKHRQYTIADLTPEHFRNLMVFAEWNERSAGKFQDIMSQLACPYATDLFMTLMRDTGCYYAPCASAYLAKRVFNMKLPKTLDNVAKSLVWLLDNGVEIGQDGDKTNAKYLFIARDEAGLDFWTGTRDNILANM